MLVDAGSFDVKSIRFGSPRRGHGETTIPVESEALFQTPVFKVQTTAYNYLPFPIESCSCYERLLYRLDELMALRICKLVDVNGFRQVKLVNRTRVPLVVNLMIDEPVAPGKAIVHFGLSHVWLRNGAYGLSLHAHRVKSSPNGPIELAEKKPSQFEDDYREEDAFPKDISEAYLLPEDRWRLEK